MESFGDTDHGREGIAREAALAAARHRVADIRHPAPGARVSQDIEPHRVVREVALDRESLLAALDVSEQGAVGECQTRAGLVVDVDDAANVHEPHSPNVGHGGDEGAVLEGRIEPAGPDPAEL